MSKKTKDNRVGLPATKRPKATTQPNQWTGSPQQDLFMELWTNPQSETFGDAYNSALQVGYSPSYAVKISAPSVANKWLSEYRKGTVFTPEHIKQGIQALAINPKEAKSPDDTRLKAYELLAKVNGMLNPKAGTVNNIVVTPILSGASTAKDVKTVDNEIVEDKDVIEG